MCRIILAFFSGRLNKSVNHGLAMTLYSQLCIKVHDGHTHFLVIR